MSSKVIDIFVDVSGSMAGYKIQAVNRHLTSLFAEIGACATNIQLYSFAESIQQEKVTKSPNLVVRKESTSFDKLGDFVATLQNKNKNGSVLVIYSDGLLVDISTEEQTEKLCRQLQTAYSIRIGIHVSPNKQKENLLCSISNSGVFGIDEDIGVVAAPIMTIRCRNA